MTLHIPFDNSFARLPEIPLCAGLPQTGGPAFSHGL